MLFYGAGRGDDGSVAARGDGAGRGDDAVLVSNALLVFGACLRREEAATVVLGDGATGQWPGALRCRTRRRWSRGGARRRR